MNNYPRVTLEQWRVFQAIIEHGGYAQAAIHLHRSQSSVSYSMSRLQEQLGFPLLKIQGRKATLTESGQALLQRSKQLLNNATEIESFAQHLSAGRESEIKLVVDAAFPNDLLMSSLAAFAKQSQGTQVQLHEIILSGASDALLNDDADLIIGVDLSNNVMSDPLIEVEFHAVAHTKHPLHSLERSITEDDLENYMHIVIRDSGQQHIMDVGWLSSQQRWTVSSIDSALSALQYGLGYGWLPGDRLIQPLGINQLKLLRLQQGQTYKANLYISFAHPQNIGPATRELADIIKSAASGLS
jgi:DNA-binding transcriptional LysR family regulator